jgi:long-chain acyl-CoA synthetase
MDKDGYITYTSRLKRLIISSGYNVYPSQIESILESHPDVMLSSVVGVPHKYKQEVPKAFIVLNRGVHESENLINELKDLCKKNLPKYALPYE